MGHTIIIGLELTPSAADFDMQYRSRLQRRCTLQGTWAKSACTVDHLQALAEHGPTKWSWSCDRHPSRSGPVPAPVRLVEEQDQRLGGLGMASGQNRDRGNALFDDR